jgi:hypothetical protein
MEIIEELNKYESINHDVLVDIAIKFKIKFKYDKTFDKILFYTTRRLKKNNNINMWCNGLIVEFTNEWKIICQPLANFTNFTKNTIKDLAKTGDPSAAKSNDETGDSSNIETEEFWLFPIHDAMIINVYYSKDQWHYGTNKSFDIREQSWRGLKYSEIINIDTLNFDKNNTYNYAFSNKKIHLFQDDKLELIAVNGIEFACAPFKICETGAELLEYIKKSKIKNISAFDDYCKTGEINLGFVVRSPSISLIFESSLFQKIARMLYKPPYCNINDINRIKKIKQIEDINYIYAKCYNFYRNDAQKLFSVMLPIFEYLDIVRNLFVTEILAVLRKECQQPVEIKKQIESFVANNEKQCNIIMRRKGEKRLLIRDLIEQSKDMSFYIYALQNQNTPPFNF